MQQQNFPCSEAEAAGDRGVGYVCLLACIAALGGLLFGYDTAVIAGAIDFLETRFELSPVFKGWAVSNVLVGCMVGAALAGPLSDCFGRKKVLLLSAVLFAVSAITSAPPRYFYELVAARMLGGLGVGMASMLVAALHRGSLSRSPSRTTGVAQSDRHYQRNAHRIHRQLADRCAGRRGELERGGGLALDVCLGDPARAAVFGLPVFRSRKPTLADEAGTRGRSARGSDAYRRRSARPPRDGADRAGDRGRRGFDPRFAAARDSSRPGDCRGPSGPAAGHRDQRGLVLRAEHLPQLRRRGVVHPGVAANRSPATDQPVVHAGRHLGRGSRGRRPLLLTTSAAMGLSLALLGGAFHWGAAPFWIFVLTLAYVGSFAVAMGPVVWVVLSEIFPTRTRGRAMGVATVCLWIACFAVSQTVPLMFQRVGAAGTFWVYGAMCVVAFFFVLLFVPETEGQDARGDRTRLAGESELTRRRPRPPSAASAPLREMFVEVGETLRRQFTQMVVSKSLSSWLVCTTRT